MNHIVLAFIELMQLNISQLYCSEHLFFIFVSSGSVVSGAGAFEVAVADALVKHKPNVKGRAQLGVQAFADALLIIPKVRDLYSHPRLSVFLYLKLLLQYCNTDNVSGVLIQVYH